MTLLATAREPGSPGAAETDARTGAHDSDHAWLPLTAAQRGVFFAHQLDPTNPCCTTAEVAELDGRPDAARLAAALGAAYAEHEQLRVDLRITADGPQQRVRAAAPVPVAVVEARCEQDAHDWLRADLARPLDVMAGELTRTALVALPDGRHWWYHAAHHVVLDGYGAQQLLRRAAELYAGAAPGSVPSLASVVAAEPAPDDAARRWWHERLRDATGTGSLTARTARPSGAPVRHTVVLDEDRQRRVAEGARRLGASLQDVLVAAVATYVARMTRARSSRVGIALMNRSLAGVGALVTARTVCTAVNVLPVEVPAEGPLGAVLDATARAQADLRLHPFVRQEDLARELERERPGARLFGVQVNLVPLDLELVLAAPSDDRPAGAAEGTEREVVRGTVRNLVAGPVEDMTVTLRGVPGRGRHVRLELDANPALHDEEDVRRHAERLVDWLETLAGASRADEVDDLDLVGPRERELVVGTFNATDHPRTSATLGRRFAAQAVATPGATALVHGDASRTYDDLLAAAQRVAAGLRDRGVGPGDVVGVALPRSFALFETVHAIALLGAVYLPLDPDLPPARTASMVQDAGATIVVTPDDVPAGTGPVEIPDDVDAPAYVLFTSGSTGRPKGVVVGHRAIDNRLAWMQHHLPLHAGDRVLHKTPISFDVSVWELFWPLQVGATVVVADPGAHRDPRAIADLVVTHHIGTLHFVPSMLRALLADRTSRERVAQGRVRTLVTSGEALAPDLVQGARESFGVTPVNLYGPTEAAIDVTSWDCVGDEDDVPIGRPVWNTACYVLDERRRPLPVGATGELWLGGVQLAAGYAGRPDLTAERFVDDPFRPGGRMYRTGDLAAWRPDGALRYLGRVDDQVKLRGQRVELGEIEQAVAGTPGTDAVVAGMVGEQLVVWFVPTAGSDGGAVVGALRAAAEARLPASFLPHHWVPVDAVPVTTSGKADRPALARTHPPAPEATAGSGPTGFLEQRVCAAVADVLGLASAGRDDDFFTLGGDSLSVLRLVAALDDDLGRRLTIADAFAHPTPRALARLLGDGAGDGHAIDEVLTLRPGAGRTPLFLLPPAGGLGWCYAGLLRSLPPDLPVHTVQAPGLAEGRPDPVADLHALAARQLAAIRTVVGDGPFHVAGWSLGGMAAHQVAATARADGQHVGAVVLLDAYPAEQWSHLAEPTEQDTLVGVLRLGGLDAAPDEPLDRDAVLERLRTSGSAVGSLPEATLRGCVVSVVEASRIVRTSAHDVLEGDATLVVAGAPRPETWLDPRGWAAHVRGELRVVEVAASHGELVRRPVADDVGALIAALVT
ncbi:non-ribosomal peptide synthetase [Cellulomonas sp. HZM]|uniref:non-ribosomal peptide synthetase n=1 Tax=Cellulomonas sp. HZM TaxID=1454010 RepID=UPI0005586A3B|nr:non-ribosomal peptide synthetase [Cellulomonas sp. HZM]